MKFSKKNIWNILLVFFGILVLNFLGSKFYFRIDLTQDKRYTLSDPTLNKLEKITTPIIIDVLLDGNFPPEFKRLQVETRQLLEEFAAKNPNIKYQFIDPLADEENTDAVIAQLQQLGLTPTQVTVNEGGKVSQELIFPWAIANLDNQSVKVPLLKNKLGASTEERVNNSVQHLEYAFTDALTKLTIKNKKKIAILKGNGQLDDIYIADFLTALRDYYSIAPFTLDSVASNPKKTLTQLQNFDLAIVAKPTKPFSEEQKHVIDQYVVNGGKMLWLIDQVAVEVDSLYNETGKTIALPRDLNLTDLLFKYGVRVNPSIINDLYFTQIVLASGEGNSSQYNPVPWVYHPMIISKNDHAINNNIEAVRLQFANPIDTLNNNIKKTVLLSSSPLSKTEGAPKQISLDIIMRPPNKETYTNGNKPVAVLLEGSFTSAYTNRVKPLKNIPHADTGKPSKMVVVSDGDIIKNQLNNGRPLELGYDKWTNNFYGNKEFLLNTVNYLLDDSGLLSIRTKKVSLAFLDTQKIAEEKTKWQLLNIISPLVIFGVFALFYFLVRRKKYT